MGGISGFIEITVHHKAVGWMVFYHGTGGLKVIVSS
jgi:hypothetical protein